MLIKGKLGDYDVVWVDHGYSYSQVEVYVTKTKKFWFFTWTSKSKVWELLDHRKKEKVIRYSPTQMREWFQSAVNEYEELKEAWANVKEETHKMG
jgi:hypothetical protein